MRYRTDFVTNSSSSSFIIARRGGLTESQKEKILAYVENVYLGGGRYALTPESTEEEIQTFIRDKNCGNCEEKIRECLVAGMSITGGNVSYEDMSWDVSESYYDIWDIMEKDGSGNFAKIDMDLPY